MKRLILSILTLSLYIGLFSGGGINAKQLDKSTLIYDVASITVPDTVRLVGLGEASHGASELQQLKADVFKALVTNNDCRVFAIEGDFGGCAKVDEYIHGGNGTAEEAVAEIGFRIYRTQELANFVQWMREYNETAAPNEDLHFAGYDMQRYDNNKAYLFDYLASASPAIATEYNAKFSDLTDEAMYNLKEDALAVAELELSSLMDVMKQNIPKAEQNTSFDFAYQCAQSMLENTQLCRNSKKYNDIRDAAMKKKVDWLCERYDGLIFLNGHNGHIAKESVSGYDCMGAQLAQSYGDTYFSIGTEVETCCFNGQDGDGYKVFKVKNKNYLTAQLDDVQSNLYYLDFASVSNNAGWQKVLNKTQQMTGLNVSFSSWQKQLPSMYTIKMVPQDCYNALIVLKKTSPTHLI